MTSTPTPADADTLTTQLRNRVAVATAGTSTDDTGPGVTDLHMYNTRRLADALSDAGVPFTMAAANANLNDDTGPTTSLVLPADAVPLLVTALTTSKEAP